jgi:hypothetical protein
MTEIDDHEDATGAARLIGQRPSLLAAGAVPFIGNLTPRHA